MRGRESLRRENHPSIGAVSHIGRPRILCPSIRPFGPTQARRWISRKPRASPVSALPNYLMINEPGIRFYSRGEIDNARRSCCWLREMTPDPVKFPAKGSGEVE